MLIITQNNLPCIELVGYGVCHPGWELERRVLSEFEFLLLVKGEMQFVLDDEPISLKQREYIVLPPDRPHAILHVQPGTCYYYAHFSVKHWYIPDEEVPKKPMSNEISFPLHGKASLHYAKMERILDEMINAERNHTVNRRLLQSGLLVQLLALLEGCNMDQASLDTLEGKASYPSMIHDALYYIENQREEARSVQHLAQTFQVTPQHFIHTFRTYVGCTPLQYINYWKIERAKTMIRMGNMSFQEISYALDWETPHYFSKIFKKTTGMTPGNYKKYINGLEKQKKEDKKL